MLETRELAQAGTRAIEQAQQGLSGTQRQASEFIETLTEQVRGTLVNVQEQNEAAIRAAASPAFMS